MIIYLVYELGDQLLNFLFPKKPHLLYSNGIKLWLLEKNKITYKVYAFISLYNLFTSPSIMLKESILYLVYS